MAYQTCLDMWFFTLTSLKGAVYLPICLLWFLLLFFWFSLFFGLVGCFFLL